MDEATAQDLVAALAALKFPLDRRDLFVALNMMGLTSRLQPLQTQNADAKKLIVSLSIELADLAIAQLDK